MTTLPNKIQIGDNLLQNNNVTVATLPSGAAQSTFKMSLHSGRDQVAVIVDNGNWEKFEYPFPTYFYACAKLWNGIIVDIGANTGFYSLLGACASRDNQVLAFEPDQSILASLDQNVFMSGLQEQISCSALALSSKSGIGTLYVPTQEHGLIETSSSLESKFKSTHSEVRQIEIETLDGFIAKSDLLEAPVSMIKIDVEGHERHVLMGAKSTVSIRRPLLFVEILNNIESAFFTEFVQENDYVDVPLSPEGIFMNSGPVQFVVNAWNHAFVPKEKIETFLQLIPAD